MVQETRTLEPEEANGFTETRRAYVVDFLGDFVSHSWFGGRFGEEEGRYLFLLFLGVYASYVGGELPTQKDASRYMGSEHSKTVRKYLKRAAQLNFIKVAKSRRDRRATLIVPTKQLIEVFEQELDLITYSMNSAAEAIVADRLPPREMISLKWHRGMKLRQSVFTLRSENAIEDYSDTIRLAPFNAHAWHQRAAAYRALGKSDKALADINEAIRHAPHDPWHFASRAELRKGNGDVAGAIADLTEAIRLNGMQPSFYIERGRIYEGLKEIDNAVADYRKAWELEPRGHPTLEERLDKLGIAG